MAITVSVYNDTTRKIQAGELIAADTYKFELLNNSATFDATNTTKTQVDNAGSYEVYGNGWTQGGMTLASVAISTVSTKNSKFSFAALSVTATGGAIGPAYKGVILNTTDSTLVCFYDFGGVAQTAGVGTNFIITPDASGGILLLTAP